MSVLDPNGTPIDNNFDDAFDGGILLGAEGRVTIKPFGLSGISSSASCAATSSARR
jgi:hypothetical protein